MMARISHSIICRQRDAERAFNTSRDLFALSAK